MAQAETRNFSFDDGASAVELARSSVRSYVLHGQREQPGSMREAFYARTGALVRLQSTAGRGGLRGCAGEYDSTAQLGHVLVDAAIAAASEDSCGSEVEAAELPSVLVSVCIVKDVREATAPLEELELGTHGVAIGGGDDAWLYPTLPVEHGWSAFEYLDRACRKAGLAPGAWEDEDVTVRLFEGAVFREREPEGSVEQV